MWINRTWRIFYDHRINPAYAQMITIVGRVGGEHCDVQRYSALKTEFSNQEEEEEDEDEEAYSGIEEPSHADDYMDYEGN